MKNYEIIQLTIRPCYIYIEGEDIEEFWIDDKNALDTYLHEDSDNKPGYLKEDETIRHYLIQCYKPKGISIDETNEHLCKYVVWLGPTDEMFHEWDFENHCSTDCLID